MTHPEASPEGKEKISVTGTPITCASSNWPTSVEIQYQWQSVIFSGTNIQEVYVLPFDGGGELRIRVEFCFPDPPVISLLPILDQPLDGVQGHTVIRAHARKLIGPANMGESRS